jgi:2-dehydropantoate 2-reductase
MQRIQNVLICGIGAVGSIIAAQILGKANLKILVDKARFSRYKADPPMLNGKTLDFDYILPNTNFKADLIIIAVKYPSLNEVINNIAGFIDENTVIMSLINGITSEEIISARYGVKHVLPTYFIGHSAMRTEHKITSSTENTIVFGGKESVSVKDFFDRVGIDYQIDEDMKSSLWRKLILNIAVNQLSAIFRLNYGQIVCNKPFLKLAKKLMYESAVVAAAEGIPNAEKLADEAYEMLSTVVSPLGKTSMLQDVENCRKTEIEIFSGTIVELGVKHNISTPYNCMIKEMIEIIEASYR